MCFGQGNDFKDVLGELTHHLESLGKTVSTVAMAMSSLESPVFKKPEEPEVDWDPDDWDSDEHKEKICAFYMEETVWEESVCD